MDKPSIRSPGLAWRPRAGGWVPYWIPSVEAKAAGFSKSTLNLGYLADHSDHLIARCVSLQAEQAAFVAGLRKDRDRFDGTIQSVLRIYQVHEDSPFHKLRPGSRKPYIIYLGKLEAHVGAVRIDRVTGLDVKRWHKVWTRGGDFPAAGSMCLSVLKAALTFAIVAGHRDCRPLRDDIRELRLPSPKPRQMVATADQVVAVRRAAHALGQPSAALSYALQFETTLRQWDVAGQWYPLDAPVPSALIDKGQKWAGLEWRHIGEDMVLRYRPSKTDATTGAEVTIDLALCPMVLEEIAAVLPEQRRGPLVVNEHTAVPYRQSSFENVWRKARAAAGLPAALWSRDLRASAVTEMRGAGGAIEDAAKVAGHTKSRTTAKVYDRARLEAHRRVAAARISSRKGTPENEP